MRKNYGLPYQGSKNQIAEEIIDFLPSGNRLVDLFGGGGGISHCASLSGKYKSVLYNEINPLVVKAFSMAINGEFDNEDRWISKEEFHRLKTTDPYVAFCFSFGNCRRTYIYGSYLEPWEKALHYARVLKDYSLLQDMGIYSSCTQLDVKEHNDFYLGKYIEWFSKECKDSETFEKDISVLRKGNCSLDRLQNYEFLTRIRELKNTINKGIIETYNGSYLNYNYKKGDIVYCDPPYVETDFRGYGGFNNAEFFDWVASRPYQVFFSEYEHDYLNDRFYKLWQTEKREVFTSQRATRLETIYSNMPYKKESKFIFGV